MVVGLLATLDTVPEAESTLRTSELEFAERVVHAPGLLESNAGRDLLGSHVGSRAVRLVVFEDAAQAFFLLAAIPPAQSSMSAALGRLIDAAPPGYRCEAVLLFFTKRDLSSTAEALARAGLKGLQQRRAAWASPLSDLAIVQDVPVGGKPARVAAAFGAAEEPVVEPIAGSDARLEPEVMC